MPETTDAVRMTIRMTRVTAERIKSVAGQLQMTQSAVINLALMAGLDALNLTSDPIWREYFERMAGNYAKANRNESTKQGDE